MDFGMALRLMARGRRMKRLAWRGRPHQHYYIDGSRRMFFQGDTRYDSNPPVEQMPSCEDMLNEDWVPIDEATEDFFGIEPSGPPAVQLDLVDAIKQSESADASAA